MQRIATVTKATDLFGAGKSGFKDGNLGTGVPPTDLEAAWFNGVQEELVNVIEAAGLVASGATLNQVVQAIAILLRQQTNTAFTTTGVAPNFVLTPTLPITAYTPNMRFRVKFHAAGTTGSNTINIAALGAKNLYQYDAVGTKVAAVIRANQLADIEYDGVDAVVLDPLAVNTAPIGVQAFTASGSFTVPAGVTKVVAEVWGGGGGGGATSQSPAGSGGGGGAGGYGKGAYAVTPGQIITVTVGTGGAGAPAGSTATWGLTGGTSSFGAFLSCTGGGGGATFVGGSSGGYGGNPSGHNAGGWKGQDGGAGTYATGIGVTLTSASNAGNGGGVAGGMGGSGGTGSGSGAGALAQPGGMGSGGGGSAGTNSIGALTAGAAGGAGMVTVTW